jgi:hypothetical protein
VLAATSLARAQSCCTTTGSSDFGSVPHGRFAAVATDLTWDRAFGSFEGDAHYRRLKSAEVDDVVWRWGGGIRLGVPWLQVYASLPQKLQYRRLSGLAPATRVGIGDAQAGLRATLVEDRVERLDAGRPATWFPFIEPFIGVRAPSGRPPDASETETQADVMGDGAWLLFGGLSLTKYVNDDNAVALAGTWGHRFSRTVTTAAGSAHRFEPGSEYDARLSWLRVIGLFWSFSVFGNLRVTGTPRTDGVEIDDGATRRVRAGASVLRYLWYPAWQVSVAFDSDLPLGGLGKNVPFAGTSLTLSLQRNFSR